MADEPNTAKPQNTQTSRRLKYGLNVTLAVLIAATLVVFLNWIAYRHYERWDLTATRRYSLSQQTEKVLANLEGEYELVTLFDYENNDYLRVNELQQVRDKIDEYDRYSDRLSVEHIDAGRSVAERDQFYKQLTARFEQDLEPLLQAIEQGRQANNKLHRVLASVVPQLQQALGTPGLEEGPTRQTIQQAMGAFGGYESQVQALDDELEQALQATLPDYTRAHTSLKAILEALEQKVLPAAVDRLEQVADQDQAPPAVQNTLLSVARELEQVRQPLQAAVTSLGEVEPVSAYDHVRAPLLAGQAVVALGPKRVQVIPASEMYRKVDPEQARQTGLPNLSFLGEERLTGTLMSMRHEHPPLVVFVISGQQPAIGPNGQYGLVAERLRAANFNVQQWNPRGQFTATGQAAPPGPPPEPEPGQQAVWVVLPVEPANPRSPFGSGGQVKQQIADHLEGRLAQGDSAMVTFSFSPSPVAQADPLAELIQSWGITPQTDRVLLEQTRVSDRDSSTKAQMQVDRWPSDLGLSQALRGMSAMFLQASPLVVSTEKQPEGIERYPLVEVRGDRIWAERNIDSAEALQRVEFNPAESAERFVIGAAAENERSRLIVMATPMWASDPITTLGRYNGQLVRGAAGLVGAAFPGNSELFVNGVYWLAGMDQMIAASARAQDIRRIEAFEPSTETAYQTALLAGLPVLVLVSGLGVWLVRRRG